MVILGLTISASNAWARSRSRRCRNENHHPNRRRLRLHPWPRDPALPLDGSNGMDSYRAGVAGVKNNLTSLREFFNVAAWAEVQNHKFNLAASRLLPRRFKETGHSFCLNFDFKQRDQSGLAVRSMPGTSECHSQAFPGSLVKLCDDDGDNEGGLFINRAAFGFDPPIWPKINHEDQ